MSGAVRAGTAARETGYLSALPTLSPAETLQASFTMYVSERPQSPIRGTPVLSVQRELV
jgi:hypothetical protein